MNSAQGNKLRPALIGGAALGVASAIPGLNCLNCACCALVIGGGILASYLYVKDSPPSPQPPYGDGAVLGLLTGVIGALVATVVGIPFQLAFRGMGWGGDPEQLQELLGAAEMPPELQGLIENFASMEMTAAGILFGLVINLVVFSIFALIGALIGVAIFHKKMAPGLPTQPPPYGGYEPPPPPPAG